MKQLRVLVLDIETKPMLAYVWGLRDQNIGLNMIHKDWGVIAWAAKWLGEKRVTYKDLRKSPNSSDRALLAPLWGMLDEADVVVTQNGKKFDSRKLNARFIELQMVPPSPYRHIDTYLVAKNAAEFTSHKLEWMTDKLCTKYKKLAHKKFPGFELWKECMAGNQAAWREMEKYNRHDVLSTEELYLKLRPWMPANAPDVYAERGLVCKACGGHRLQRRGTDVTNKSVYHRYQCRDCGKWSRGERINAKL